MYERVLGPTQACDDRRDAAARTPEAGLTRVLCLTSWYPPHHFGGYEVGCYDVMTRLERRGHHVEVLCSDEAVPGATAPDPDHEGHVHRTLRLYYRDGDVWTPPWRERLAIERHNQRALAEALAACRPDVVSVWHVGAMSVGLLTTLVDHGLPVVYDIQDLWPAYAVKLDPWLRLWARSSVLGRAVARATGVPATVPDLDAAGGACFISAMARDQVRTAGPWRFPRSGIVYSGIEPALFHPPAGERERPWRWRLAYVGRLDPRKGIDTVLRALPLLPEATLAVIGRGSDAQHAHLLDLAAELGVRDRITVGAADRADLPARYADADVCAFPSEWQEPFGLVPLEAMGCGTPVVATGVGGSGEYLRDEGNCLLFPAGDHVALAAAIERLAGDAPLRSRLVAGGLETAAFFDVEAVADELEAWHGDAVAGFPDGARPDRVPPTGTPSGPR